MKDLTPKVTLDNLTAIEFNSPTDELENIVLETGQTLDASGSGVNDPDTNQAGKAIAHYASTGLYYLDSGGVNSFVLAHADSIQLPPAYSEGFSIRFVAANTSTGASTISVGSLGSVSLLTNLGAPLIQGAVVAGSFVVAHYDGANFRLDFENFGLGDTLSGVSSTDLNTLVTTGFFRPFFSAPNNPTLTFTPSEDGTLIVQSIDADNTTQQFICVESDRVFIRRQFVGIWEEWYQNGRPPEIHYFDSFGGPFSYNKPVGLKKVRVWVCGAGGAGSAFPNGGGGAGGGGTEVKDYLASELAASTTYNVGQGGSNTTSGTGGSGTLSNFLAVPGGTITGNGGTGAQDERGAPGAQGSGGDITLYGSAGTNGNNGTDTGGAGTGGSSHFGGGGRPAAEDDENGGSGFPIGGGGGGSFTGESSGAGATGAVIVEEFF